MPTFRRRPDEIEAIQWDRRISTLAAINDHGFRAVEDGMSISGKDGRGVNWRADPFDWVVFHGSGWIEVMSDWEFKTIWEPDHS